MGPDHIFSPFQEEMDNKPPFRELGSITDRNDWTKNMAEFRRVHFLTDSGLMGNGSQYMLLEDEIMLIRGLSLPAVLGRQGERHRLIGYAVIEGMLDGQGWENFREADLTKIMLI